MMFIVTAILSMIVLGNNNLSVLLFSICHGSSIPPVAIALVYNALMYYCPVQYCLGLTERDPMLGQSLCISYSVLCLYINALRSRRITCNQGLVPALYNRPAPSKYVAIKSLGALDVNKPRQIKPALLDPPLPCYGFVSEQGTNTQQKPSGWLKVLCIGIDI